jgi:SAM-dependent methyltransferase
MAEITDSEIDVERLMTDIRAAVAKREAEGQRSLLKASMELYNLLSTSPEPPIEPGRPPTLSFQAGEYDRLAPLWLQPAFTLREDDHYHVNDLLQYHDHTFIWNAYRALLKREPDEEGLREFLKKLRSGRFNKVDVLAGLRYSPEGQSRNVQVDGLARLATIRRLYRIPVIGYLLEMVVGIARLPAMLRSQRQFEGHALTQQDVIAVHLNQLSRTTFQVIDSLSRELTGELTQVSTQLSAGQKELAEYVTREVTEVTAAQRKFAELQYEQIVGLYREQRELLSRVKRMRDELDARLARLKEATRSQSNEPQRTAHGQAPPDETFRHLDELLASLIDEFRGRREEIKEGFKFYLPLLKKAGIERDILDLGCGRGEWLELLREEGFEGCGVEANLLLVERGKSLGLEITGTDALAYLRALPEDTLNAVTGFHFIEHLPFETLLELLDEIKRALRPGGLVILETPNPKNLVVGACNFYSDPTHFKPLFPETVQFLLSKRGFRDVQVEYVNPVGGSPFKDGSEASKALDSWFFSPRDFAVTGRKP